jgi:hypothetical protein
MAVSTLERRRNSSIGGRRTIERHGADVVALRARQGLRERFESLVDPEHQLDPHLRGVLAEAARRGFMFAIATRSRKRTQRFKPIVLPNVVANVQETKNPRATTAAGSKEEHDVLPIAPSRR